MKTVKIRVSGEVHGVGFRDYVSNNARELGLSGWVRNRKDDTVEIEASGAQTPLDNFLEIVKKGPPNSVVANIDIDWQEIAKSPSGDFHILETK